MNTYHRALIDYWLEIGKLKRVRSRCFKNIATGEIRENHKRLAETQSMLDCWKKVTLFIGGWVGYYENGKLISEYGSY